MAINSMEHEGTAADMNRIPKAGWHLPAKNGPICFSPLSISEDVLAEVRNCGEVRQANRAVRHRDLSGRRERRNANAAISSYLMISHKLVYG